MGRKRSKKLIQGYGEAVREEDESTGDAEKGKQDEAIAIAALEVRSEMYVKKDEILDLLGIGTLPLTSMGLGFPSKQASKRPCLKTKLLYLLQATKNPSRNYHFLRKITVQTFQQ